MRWIRDAWTVVTKHALKRTALASHFVTRANELRELTERATPPKVKASTREWWDERRRRENSDLIALEYTPPPVSCVPRRLVAGQTMKRYITEESEQI